jgi:hypothetical protein
VFRFSSISSDEEDEEDDPQGNDGGGQDESSCDGQVSSTKRRKGENDAGPVVKTEEGEEPVLAKTARQCHRTPSNELHIYSAAELSRLNQRELLADVQLLDGVFVFASHLHVLMFYHQSK